MKLIIEINDVTDIDTVLLNKLHAIHNKDSFFMEARTAMKEDGYYQDGDLEIMEELPKDICKVCSCSEFLCGHNKR